MDLRIHRNIALTVIRENASLVRACGIWYYLRKSATNYTPYYPLVKELSEKFSAHPESVKRWLKEGNGIFWNISEHKGNKVLWIISRKKVFQTLNIERAGNLILLVDESLIFQKSLRKIKAAFYQCWNYNKPSFISRENIQILTGVKRDAQLRYDKVLDVKTTRNYYENGTDTIPLPNIYHPKHCRLFMVQREKKYGFLSTTGKNPVEGDSSTVVDNPQVCSLVGKLKKTLFDSEDTAIKECFRRARLGLSGTVFVIDWTKKGNKRKHYEYSPDMLVQ